MGTWLGGLARVLLLGGALAVLVGGGAAQAAPAAGPAAARPGDLAYTAYQAGQFDLYVVHADGSGDRRLTHLGDARHPAWSPDGSTLAYDAGGWVWLLTPGSGSRRLTPGAEPAWSPDGRRLLVTRPVRGYLRDVLVVPVSGGPATRLTWTASAGCTAGSPAWRGSDVVFVRSAAGSGGCSEGIVLQRRPGGPRLLVADAGARSLTPRPSGALLYTSSCDPARCNGEGVWRWAPGGTPDMVVDAYVCAEGDLCLQGLAGLARGWVTSATYADEEGGDATTCFQGWVRPADGTVSRTAPAFCVPRVFLELSSRP